MQRYGHAVMTAARIAFVMITIAGAQQAPPGGQQPQRPNVPNPTTPGERTRTPPETPPPPQNPPQAAPQQTGAAPFVANAYESTYKPFPSRTTVIRNATILTAARPVIEHGSILLQGGKVARVGQSAEAP